MSDLSNLYLGHTFQQNSNYVLLNKLPGLDLSGNPVFLKDIWPTRRELQEVERQYVVPAMFKETYSKITDGNSSWNSIESPDSQLYCWDPQSSYVKSPPFFDDMSLDVPGMHSIKGAYALLNLGDSVTTGNLLYSFIVKVS